MPLDLTDPKLLYKIKNMDTDAIILISPALNKLVSKLLRSFKGINLEPNDVVSEVFFEMASKNLPDDLTCPPLVYLFGISKNLICKQYRKYGKEIPTDFNFDENEYLHNEMLNAVNDDEDDHQINKRLKNLIPFMSESCQNLIKAYFTNTNAEDIANLLDYKSPTTVHARKNQCLDKLAEIIEKRDPWLAKKLKKRNKKKYNDS